MCIGGYARRIHSSTYRLSDPGLTYAILYKFAVMRNYLTRFCCCYKKKQKTLKALSKVKLKSQKYLKNYFAVTKDIRPTVLTNGLNSINHIIVINDLV